MSPRGDYIRRYETARAEMMEIVQLASGSPTIYEPWLMKEVFDHITEHEETHAREIRAIPEKKHQHLPGMYKTPRTILSEFYFPPDER